MRGALLFASWWSGVWSWLWGLGGVGLVMLAVADNAPFLSSPAGSVDIFLILLAGGHPQSWAWYALAASAGEIAGGYVTYRVSLAGSRKTLDKKIGEAATRRICQWFERSAFLTVFLGAILPPPFPFTSVLMAAGIMQYSSTMFITALTAGRGVRYFTTAWLARLYGRQMIALLARNYRPALYTLTSLALVGGIAGLIYWRVRSRRGLDSAKTHKA
jgi:membrane protein YqaA with SNARE-associated domain